MQEMTKLPDMNSRYDLLIHKLVSVDINATTSHDYVVMDGFVFGFGFSAGTTALMVAAQDNNYAVVKALIDSGACINTVNADGFTALILAAWKGHRKIVEILIEHGAFTDLRVRGGDSALTLACSTRRKSRKAIIELLINNGAHVDTLNDVGRWALNWLLCQHPGPEEVVMFIREGASVNAANLDGSTPLTIVADSGRLDLTELLLKNNATAGLNDALVRAIRNGHHDVENRLLLAGADPTIKTDGRSAIEWKEYLTKYE
ncbi:ankyrin repeat domain-containing protein [Citrobacter meridianamericanus]|uniref:Ankyrin repeat domain-containing protein n=1 Tax=Citrobacter meridianamericanus TaxID=2894201 RepID=A0ABT1BFE7_9ENTR|nr:ankyrin repeat domain-containing protein [Citrobacter meridianamericanus]MCO5784612.1 ankyrin repeat domain-containing protein [Citrobacter meridianamericanus]